LYGKSEIEICHSKFLSKLEQRVSVRCEIIIKQKH